MGDLQRVPPSAGNGGRDAPAPARQSELLQCLAAVLVRAPGEVVTIPVEEVEGEERDRHLPEVLGAGRSLPRRPAAEDGRVGPAVLAERDDLSVKEADRAAELGAHRP